MSPSHVFEPTYQALRRRLLAGAWPAGHRLESARLAAELSVSITPVRDSLNRLAGERLVQAAAGAGFQVLRLDGAGVRGLYEWHHALIRLAISQWKEAAGPLKITDSCDGLAERSAILFLAVTGQAGNFELDWAVGNVAARLGHIRRNEAKVLLGVPQELAKIEATLEESNKARLLKLVDAYHLRRLRHAFELTYEQGDAS